ncbi:MAG: hypothetical protein V4724_17055 [Pseudomonadota bacterium]
MIKIVSTVLAFSCVLLSGCTTANMYDVMQDNVQDRCRKLLEPERSACLKNNQTDYQTYKKQRDQVTGASKQ